MPAALLEKYGKTAANPPRTEVNTVRRRSRLKAREFSRRLDQRKTVRTCGYAAGEAGVRIRASISDGASSGGICGVKTCGSVWVCPVCASKIAASRTLDLEDGITLHAERGGSFMFLTLTSQHHKGDRLKDSWDGISGAYRKWISDGTVKRTLSELGSVGYHRTTEVTHGVNGWHVHLHLLIFLQPISDRPGDLTFSDLGNRLVGRWLCKLPSVGMRGSALGQDWRHIYGSAESLRVLAGYVNKNQYVESTSVGTAGNLAMEMGRGDLKRAREGGETPFQILDRLVESAGTDVEAARLWCEWSDASAGRRQQIWSRGLRARLDLDVERTDEEIAAEALDGTDLVALDRDIWMALLNGQTDLIDGALTACSGHVDLATAQLAVSGFLKRFGVPHRVLPLGVLGACP